MSLSLILAFFWIVAANLIGMFPSKRNHWPAAYVLIAVGVPLVGYVTYENGPLVGVIALAAGASILRWPVFYLWKWARHLGKAQGNEAE
ncbi:MAG: DUF2484 family protein [Paracoccaceae bacterium]